MALFKRNNNTTEDSHKLDSYVDNLVSDNDPDINLEIESNFSPARPAYRIEDAVELMRRLPQDNTDMVISVVRETLKSASIDVEKIIVDAESKTTNIELNIHSLNTEIDALEKKVAEKKVAIESAQKSLVETQRVKALLEQSQKVIGENHIKKVVKNLENESSPEAQNNTVQKDDLTANG